MLTYLINKFNSLFERDETWKEWHDRIYICKRSGCGHLMNDHSHASGECEDYSKSELGKQCYCPAFLKERPI